MASDLQMSSRIIVYLVQSLALPYLLDRNANSANVSDLMDEPMVSTLFQSFEATSKSVR